jgi:hypothetical protein
MVFSTDNWQMYLLMMILTVLVGVGVTFGVVNLYKDNKRNIKLLHGKINGLVYDVTTTDDQGTATTTETLVLEDLDY